MMDSNQKRQKGFAFSIRLWGIITAAGCIAGGASILGFFGHFSWFLDLFSHFRGQYFLTLSVCALIISVFRKYKLGVCFGVLALINLFSVLPLYFGGSNGLTK